MKKFLKNSMALTLILCFTQTVFTREEKMKENTNLQQEKKGEKFLNSIEEILKFKKSAEKKYKEKTGKQKLWGKPDIPPLLHPKGKVLYTDSFDNLDNWYHEGCGALTLPEKNVMQLNCTGSRQGAQGCMGFCKKDFPDNICIEYDMKTITSNGLFITFIAAQGRHGEDMITELPHRKGTFPDYVYNSRLRSYHVSISRYNDKGKHTGISNWRRNPGLFLMGQQEDLCKTVNEWHHIYIIKKGGLLQMAVDGKLAGGFVDADEIPDAIPKEGKIGFRTIGSKVIVRVKNFKVTSLE